MTIPTLNVSVDQIRSDLRGGKTVDQIAAEWSEPVANVRAVLTQMQREAGRSSSTTPERPLRPVPTVAQPPALDLETVRLIDLVTEASQSTSSQTRKLGARLDTLAETVAERLSDERATAAERAAAEGQRAEALAEVQRLEDQLREARARLGGARAPASPSRSKAGAAGGVSTTAAYDGGPPSSVIRAWAREQAIEVPAKGTLPKAVVDRYREAHP